MWKKSAEHSLFSLLRTLRGEVGRLGRDQPYRGRAALMRPQANEGRKLEAEKSREV